MKIYQVGGAVRDGLLGRPVSDRDWVVVGADAQQLLDLGYRQVGADFPVFLHPETHEEYALARTERKSGQGYKGFVTDSAPHVTLEEDLARRDFTINAMALDDEGRLIDPYGGQTDLAAGLLRHITPAFREDPLRVLRAARFAARFGYRIADETLALMREIAASGELETLAAERVCQELRRALVEPHPARFIEVLRDCGALAVLMPEVDRLFGVPQPAKHHPEIDTGVHVLMALAQGARRNAPETVRFAVLTHDLGKGETPADILPSHHGHEARGVPLVEALCARLKMPKEHRELAVLVARLHTKVHLALELRPDTVLRLLNEADALRRRARFEEFLEACHIDACGRLGLEDRAYPQTGRLRAALDVVAAVAVQPLLDQGLRGPALAEALQDARLAALRDSGI
ncbi:MAG: multifunctional CCA addition/repair protein [Gammaproteobacteria bacterium]|nr:multifunctional CCA addition/repair protein [Gammaproteobacteria bacterium]